METSTRYYYSLGEIIGGVGTDNVVYMLPNVYDYKTLQDDNVQASKGWLGMIGLWINHSKTALTEPAALASDEVIELLATYVLPKCYYCDVCISDTDYSAVLDDTRQKDVEASTFADAPEEIKSFVSRVAAWLMGTYPKYKKLLDLYKAQETKLMDKLTTTTSGKTRFNDMPQSPIAAGDIDGDDHLTNLTKDDNESATDPETPMMRLAEIQANYKNIYNDWCDEFVKTFIIM
jgi:hypothetical protein